MINIGSLARGTASRSPGQNALKSEFDLGDYIRGVTPVPIPNTVVKPSGADDTGTSRESRTLPGLWPAFRKRNAGLFYLDLGVQMEKKSSVALAEGDGLQIGNGLWAFFMPRDTERFRGAFFVLESGASSVPKVLSSVGENYFCHSRMPVLHGFCFSFIDDSGTMIFAFFNEARLRMPKFKMVETRLSLARPTG